ncbi:hypothetical protein HSBAA_55730 [Vreelandella sulfidaeris]|uniref:Uncharacterized protein n=1 Tax=Vreelandella sulfidaeris TaxID=115553 RepID=A0A455UF22_9GAMM|nr:hypothetical protein HSBAA_55730 [Halomonas sulfidaeris]
MQHQYHHFLLRLEPLQTPPAKLHVHQPHRPSCVAVQPALRLIVYKTRSVIERQGFDAGEPLYKALRFITNSLSATGMAKLFGKTSTEPVAFQPVGTNRQAIFDPLPKLTVATASKRFTIIGNTVCRDWR